MRDLQKDLEKWITDHDIGAHGEWFYMTGEYIERAIKAEAEVERLQAENALLRKVVDLVSTMQESESGYSARLAEIEMLKVLDEYQTWKEGQDGKSI
jgi:hypothetical protein